MNHATSHLSLLRRNGGELISINSAMQNVRLRADPVVFRRKYPGPGKVTVERPCCPWWKL